MSAHEIRRIAVNAECDPRSVRRYLAGQPVRDLVRVRIERVLAAEGIRR